MLSCAALAWMIAGSSLSGAEAPWSAGESLVAKKDEKACIAQCSGKINRRACVRRCNMFPDTKKLIVSGSFGARLKMGS